MNSIKVENFPCWIFAFMTIYVTDDSLLFGTNSNEIFIYLKYVFYTVINLYFFQKSLGKNIGLAGLKSGVFIIFISFILILSSLSNSDLRNGTFLFIYTLITASLFVNKYSFQVFAKCYVYLLYLFAFASLITYILNITIPSLFNMFPIITNFGGVPFKYLGIANLFDGFNFTRNLSVFREPGVYSIHLCISIIIQLFYNQKFINKKVLGITILALFTTLSTSGILVFSLILLFYNIRNRKINQIIYSGIFIGFLFFIINYNPDLFDFVFSKFDKNSTDYASSLSRTASLYIPLKIISENPILGIGLTAFVKNYSLISLELYGVFLSSDSAATNTILNFSSVYGIPSALLLIFAMVGFAKLIDKKMYLIILGLLVLLISSQELRYSLLFSVIIMYGVSSHFKVKNK